MEMIVVDSYIQWTQCNVIPRGEIIHDCEPLPSKYCVFTSHNSHPFCNLISDQFFNDH